MTKYRIEVARRPASDHGSDVDPWSAVAWKGKQLVAVQYGTHAPIAFARALEAVKRDREREPVEVEVTIPGRARPL